MTTGAADEKRLLLVEDDELQARLYRTMLHQQTDNWSEHSTNDSDEQPATVETADTLEGGLSALEDASEPFAAVLLDLNLPDSAGLETLNAVLEVVEETPVVVLTGISGATVGREAVERGAQDYLMKEHVTPRLLSQTVTYAIERRRRTGELDRQRRELAVLHWLVRQEIRDDATIVLGWASELEPSGSDEIRTVSRIVEAAERIVELTEFVGATVQALEASQSALTSVDLGSVLEEEIERLERRYDGCKVTLDRPAGAIPTLADRFLNILVRALLTSAVDSDDKSDGEVTVSVRCDRGADRPVELAVFDTDAERQPASRDRVADRDHTANGSDSDVGDYLIRTFVDRYDGRLEIEAGTNEGSGATVRLSLETPTEAE
ncbi:response regulator [Salinadaptatus halalkaliphilus]|uniref:Response regulator n=1 Tax=Salinadaptatus halalkaliphilus TaxID=2419781 RepID=A0A4S3TPD4_9EURY|nr:response regulator [Salinadaptatus halalkaliphilus]THE64458.1 response regulator [Salinadaptatus halalkaliphilus]